MKIWNTVFATRAEAEAALAEFPFCGQCPKRVRLAISYKLVLGCEMDVRVICPRDASHRALNDWKPRALVATS